MNTRTEEQRLDARIGVPIVYESRGYRVPRLRKSDCVEIRRNVLNLSQRQLANRLGIALSTVQSNESEFSEHRRRNVSSAYSALMRLILENHYLKEEVQAYKERDRRKLKKIRKERKQAMLETIEQLEGGRL